MPSVLCYCEFCTVLDCALYWKYLRWVACIRSLVTLRKIPFQKYDFKSLTFFSEKWYFPQDDFQTVCDKSGARGWSFEGDLGLDLAASILVLPNNLYSGDTCCTRCHHGYLSYYGNVLHVCNILLWYPR